MFEFFDGQQHGGSSMRYGIIVPHQSFGPSCKLVQRRIFTYDFHIRNFYLGISMTNFDDAGDGKLILMAFTSQIKPAIRAAVKNPAISFLLASALYNASCAYFVSFDTDGSGGKYHALLDSEIQTRVVIQSYFHWIVSLLSFCFSLILMALNKINQSLRAARS